MVSQIFEEIFETLKDGGFIIAIENLNDCINFEILGFNIIFSRRISDTEKIVLLSKVSKFQRWNKNYFLIDRIIAYFFILQKTSSNSLKTAAIEVTSGSYSWISNVRNILTNMQSDDDEALIIYSQNDATSGILGFFNCLRKEKRANISK